MGWGGAGGWRAQPAGTEPESNGTVFTTADPDLKWLPPEGENVPGTSPSWKARSSPQRKGKVRVSKSSWVFAVG